MSDVIVLIWVAFVFFAAVFFSSISIVLLFKKNQLAFDKGFVLLLSASVLSVLLCFSIWPPMHRVYDDELSYTSQSINIVLYGKPSITIKGSRLHPEALASWVMNTKFPGFAFLEAIVLFITKDFSCSYFILNIFLGFLSVAAVYRIAWLLTMDRAVAWWSAVFLACLPVRITYSMSAASDIAGLLFCSLFFLFLIEYKFLKAKRILYAAVFCGVYAIFIKLFYGIFFMIGISIAFYNYRKASHQVLLDTFCLCLPLLAGISLMLLSDSKAGVYSFSFMINNLYTSLAFLFNSKQNTVLTPLALLAALVLGLFDKKDKLTVWVAAWFLGGLLLISAFCAGGISYPGNAYSDRYLLCISLPMVFLAGKGIVIIISKTWPRLLGTAFFIILILNAFFASKHLTAEARESFYPRKTLLLYQVLHLIPHDAYFLDSCAALISTMSTKKSIQTEIFLNGDHPGKVVFLKGIADDLYDPDDSNRLGLVRNILNTDYRCQALTASPLKEAGLSATPFLCIRK